MGPIRSIEEAVKNRFNVAAGRSLHDRVLAHVRRADDQAKESAPALNRPVSRRMIMKSPFVKLGIAAAVVVAVLVGLSQLGGSSTGVAWGEVAQKMAASRGVTVRCTETGSVSLDNDDYAIKYLTPTQSRTDSYKDGQIVRTFYSNLETMTFTGLFHPHKDYLIRPITSSSEGFLEKHEDWTNPRYLVQTILSGKHRELEPQTIDGVLCEGIETTDPNVMGPMPGEVTRLDVEMRLWIDANTQYPVRFEGKVDAEAEGEVISSECVMDQFRWDVDLDPSLFEPNIPPDYKNMDTE